jgi:wyosine [tRNA(Phe)-imidazoG37] synthetase (radical SAM superfamily)
LGQTTVKTLERREWVPLDEVVEQVRERLSLAPDYITLTGSGEPTLHGWIDAVIGHLRAITDTPIAVLTNGSLLWEEELRQQLLGADLVIPSLDAGQASTFKAVNRPHAAISFDMLMEGLVAFRKEFKGAYWLEVLLLDGFTSDEEEVERIAACVREIGPTRVQLNTVSRPGAESFAKPVPLPRLRQLAELFTPRAEVIADFPWVQGDDAFAATESSVLDMLQRRPCTVEDIAHGLGMSRNAAIKHLDALGKKELVRWTTTPQGVFYVSPHI